MFCTLPPQHWRGGCYRRWVLFWTAVTFWTIKDSCTKFSGTLFSTSQGVLKKNFSSCQVCIWERTHILKSLHFCINTLIRDIYGHDTSLQTTFTYWNLWLSAGETSTTGVRGVRGSYPFPSVPFSLSFLLRPISSSSHASTFRPFVLFSQTSIFLLPLPQCSQCLGRYVLDSSLSAGLPRQCNSHLFSVVNLLFASPSATRAQCKRYPSAQLRQAEVGLCG